jgi:hypothetical protein
VGHRHATAMAAKRTGTVSIARLLLIHPFFASVLTSAQRRGW